MKKCIAIISAAVILTLVMSVMLLTVSTSAIESRGTERVVFVSDNAVEGGDGSSADSPLYPEEVPAYKVGENTSNDGEVYGKYYLESALYQAAEMLIDTGGTIVICGPVQIDRNNTYGSSPNAKDFTFPESDRELVITSVYDGVDYAETNGAYLGIATPAFVTFESPVTMENMTIKTTGKGRVICAKGHPIVMGDGITCSYTDELTDEEKKGDGSYYISIAGGRRYGGLVGDTNITIKSGTYAYVCGSNWGTPRTQSVTTTDSEGNETTVTEKVVDPHTGDVYIDMSGGRVRVALSGSSINYNVVQNGNVYMQLSGNAAMGGQIYGTGSGKFGQSGYEVYVKITDGKYYNASTVNKVKSTATTLDGQVETHYADKYTLDIADASVSPQTSGSSEDTVFNIWLGSGYDVLYPAKWLTGLSVVTYPDNTAVFKNDTLTAEGAKLSLSFTNGYDGTTAYTNEVEYNKTNTAFKTVCDTTSTGTKTVTYYYGDTQYHSEEINVLEAPVVTIKGAQIRTDTSAQKMRYWAEYTNAVSEGVSIIECGVISIASNLLVSEESFNHTETYGMFDTQPSEDDLLENIGAKTIFTALALNGGAIRENNYDTDYTARAYVKISYDGKFYYRYSDAIERNPCLVATLAISHDIENDTVKDWLKTNVIDVNENYDPTYEYYTAGATNARNKVVSYMESMRDIKWTPAETFIIYNDQTSDGSTAMKGIFYKGVEYNGLPYINYNIAQTESFLDKIEGSYTPLGDDTVSITSNSDWSKLTAEQIAVGNANARSFPGNDCVGAVILAWNTVLNNRAEIQSMTSTYSVIPGKGTGVIGVGSYDYSNNYDNNTDQMVAANGEQTMAEAYAKLQPGDATIYVRSDDTNNPRHARLVVEDPVVVRNSNGTINLEASYVTCLDQAAGSQTRNIVGDVLTSIQTKDHYFSDLITEGSLPITIPELATGHTDGEFTYVTELDLKNDLPDSELSGIIRSNRQIISVRVTFSQNGAVVKEIKDTISLVGANYHTAEYDLSSLDLSGISLNSGEVYTFDLYTCVSGINGREVHLVSEYGFTAN